MTESNWPFLGSEALAAKTLPERAMRTLCEPVYPGVYVPSGIDLTAGERAQAAWLWSRRRAVVAGQSAAALLGAKWVDATASAELVYANRHPPAGITVHSETLLADEVVRVVSGHPGARGIVRLRRVLPLVDGGAESPQETRTRLALIDAGLPKPQTQIAVCDGYGEFVARIDMGYEDLRVGIEYDGPQHWTNAAQRDRDIDRYTALLDLGWSIVRVSSELIRYRLGTFIARVVAALRAAGWHCDGRV